MLVCVLLVRVLLVCVLLVSVLLVCVAGAHPMRRSMG